MQKLGDGNKQSEIMSIMPIYIQIYSDIKKQIELGIYEKDQLIPSENVTSEKYKVSRVTVQKAFRLLESENYIYSVPGKGNFSKGITNDKYKLKFDELNIQGNKMNARLLSLDIIKPNIELVYHLQIPINKRIIAIRRLIVSEKLAIAYDIKYIPYYSGVPINEIELQFGTFQSMVSSIISPYDMKKELVISGINPDNDVQKALGIDETYPVILVEQKILDQDNMPIAWGRFYYRYEYLNFSADAIQV